MAELTRERREEMRRRFAFLLEAPLIFETVTIPTADLLALLDAADERDRLREALTPSAETKDAYIEATLPLMDARRRYEETCRAG